MGYTGKWLPLFLSAVALVSASEKRETGRLHHEQQEQETVRYYTVADPQNQEAQLVFVSAANQYNGLFGQPTATPRRDRVASSPSRGSTRGSSVYPKDNAASSRAASQDYEPASRAVEDYVAPSRASQNYAPGVKAAQYYVAAEEEYFPSSRSAQDSYSASSRAAQNNYAPSARAAQVNYIPATRSYPAAYIPSARIAQEDYSSSSGESEEQYVPPSKVAQSNYIPSSRAPTYKSQSRAEQAQSAKAKETPKTPPVQTIRNYNKVNDDGSFTFGYEAADGSFKEETRGTDCVVRGKYGYVDPDGNKREFTYVSGNPCDPNAPKQQADESAERESAEADNEPANYPTRPIRPLPTAAPKAAVTLFQNNYDREEEEQPEPEQVLKPQSAQQSIQRRPYLTRPRYESDAAQLYSTTPSSLLYKQSVTPINITPRPVVSTTARSQLPATTYRPQLLQVAVTPRPASLYTKQFATLSRVASSTQSPPSNNRGIDFDSELQRYQLENNVVSPTPSSLLKTTPRAKPLAVTPTAAAIGNAGGSGPVYSSALVYDPASGQYNTQLYQTLPQTEGQFSLNHRIQPYVAQPQSQRQLYNLPQLQQLRQSSASNPQALYQQQQAELQFQNSAQLFAQQQRARTQLQPQPSTPQSFYYVQPSLQQSAALAGGQIDSFLRGHNIQF